MLKSITFKEFQDSGYDEKNLSKHQLAGKCILCQKNYIYNNFRNFLEYRKKEQNHKHFWNTCQSCWKSLAGNKFKEKPLVTFLSLESSNFIEKGFSNQPISGKCVKCSNNYEYRSVKTFLKNRKNKIEKKEHWNTCQNCWLLLNTSGDPLWIKKNSEAQLIAQNKPDQKKKNAEGVSKSWTKERKLKGSEYLKKRWLEDEDFAKRAMKNLDWTNTKDGRFELLLRGSIGIGGLQGVYKEFYYDSALELSFILWCENNNIKIKRYDLPGIVYLDENKKIREYFPDIIIEENIIVEIKGLGLYYKKNYERNLLKNEILEKWTCENNYSARIIFSNDQVLTKNYKLARKIHYENYPKKIDTI